MRIQQVHKTVSFFFLVTRTPVFKFYIALWKVIRKSSNQPGIYWLPFQLTFRGSWEMLPSETEFVSFLWTAEKRLHSNSEYQTFLVTWPLACRDLLVDRAIYPFHIVAFTSSGRLQHRLRLYELSGGGFVLLCLCSHHPLRPELQLTHSKRGQPGILPCLSPQVSETRQFHKDPFNL